ncbi:glycosyltransferase [Jeotgalibacillus campisalis]|uniref:Glycosyl transferase family 1 n=1 Tax=Jeotgalibacillus campisalis TaxID=220754 RepID=A0A0C2V285_9BACL|nr:glycosyltransferase [Jeotgalibacillus campisalis]KIL43162.1 hypothetical protein KR50_35650 [Jeotgalibacillus campisalis]
MKILHILFHSEPISTGYSLRTKYVLKNLIKKKNNIEHIALTSSYQNLNSNINNKEDLHYYRTKKISNSIFMNMVYLYSSIKSIHKKENINVVHIHSPWLVALPAIIFCKLNRVSSIYEIRGFWEDTNVSTGKMKENSIKYKIIKKIESFCVSNADARVAISKNIIKDLNSRIGHNKEFQHIPNGVDIAEIKTKLKAKTSNITDDFVIGYISSIRELEGIQILLEAAEKIVSKYSNIKILIVGDGEYLNNLKSLTRSLGIQDNVEFTGKVKHEDISYYYNVIDIFVIPRISKRVNHIVTPLKPYEALAYKKAIISSDVGGLKEIFTDQENALLFKADSPIDLADKIKELYEDNKLKNYLEVNGLKYAENHDWGVITDKYQEVYDKFVERKN